MTSILELTTKVKASHPPCKKPRASRKKGLATAMPYYSVHSQAPTLPDVHQAAAGVLARWLMGELLRAKGGRDGR
jgi:hypothetical protein